MHDSEKYMHYTVLRHEKIIRLGQNLEKIRLVDCFRVTSGQVNFQLNFVL